MARRRRRRRLRRDRETDELRSISSFFQYERTACWILVRGGRSVFRLDFDFGLAASLPHLTRVGGAPRRLPLAALEAGVVQHVPDQSLTGAAEDRRRAAGGGRGRGVVSHPDRDALPQISWISSARPGLDRRAQVRLTQARAARGAADGDRVDARLSFDAQIRQLERDVGTSYKT